MYLVPCYTVVNYAHNAEKHLQPQAFRRSRALPKVENAETQQSLLSDSRGVCRAAT